LEKEVEPPVGQLALVFTDIKNSTALWDMQPVAMQASIKIHNNTMRRLLRSCGGYEVKTEGDAFMVAFPSATSAVLWCFIVQLQMQANPWPQEILDTDMCKAVSKVGPDGKEILISRGISVRMGVHWGSPVCEIDPVTKRMDYYGPMVNRSARVSGAADGGEIYVSSDVVRELSLLVGHPQKAEDNGDDDNDNEDVELDLAGVSLKQLEMVIVEIGEVKLKGLEHPETLSMVRVVAHSCAQSNSL
jgi:adenylate cyclase